MTASTSTSGVNFGMLAGFELLGRVVFHHDPGDVVDGVAP